MRAHKFHGVLKKALVVRDRDSLGCHCTHNSSTWPTFAAMTVKTIGGRLFAFDRRIVLNGIRAAFASWPDRFVAVVGGLVVLGGVRGWFADRPWSVAIWVGFAFSVVIGVGALRLIASRLAFHAFDGPLAADALHVPARWRYIFAWHTIGLLGVAAVTLIARTPVVVVSLPGYATGALLGGAALGLGALGQTGGSAQYRRMMRSWAQRPSAGVLGAAILCISVVTLSGMAETDVVMALVGVEAALVLLALTTVDHATVIFLTTNGYGLWRIVAHHGRGAMLFLVFTAPVCAVIYSPAMTAIVVACSIAAMLLMGLRIAVYRIHGRRAADLLVSISITLMALLAVSVLILAPFVAIILMGHVLRRAAMKTWLLA